MDFPRGQTLVHSDFRQDEAVSCDFAVVGSGAGGAAAAWELSGHGHKVLLLEEGRHFEPEALSTRPSWAYRNLYQERATRIMAGNLYIPLPGGRAVGGSTLLNSAICFRTPDRLLEKWRTGHGIGWAEPEQLRPIFEAVEREIGVTKTHPTQARANNLIFKAGCDALGVPGDFLSRSAPGCIGCGLCQLGCPIGGKGSVDRNLVPAAVERGAALFTSARATRLLVENRAAVGLEAAVLEPLSERPLRKLTVRAKKVFLCGGAVGTPLFLLTQGLANSSGQVGKHLRVHPATGMCARFEQVIDAWHGVTQGYYVDLEDSMLETFSATPDLYYTQFRAFAEPIEHLRHIASCGCLIGDESSGEVRPGLSPGRAAISYQLLENDKRRLLKGLREIGRIFFAAGALEVHAGIHNAPKAHSLAELEAQCREEVPVTSLSVYASHPLGTCRMGADRAAAVVGQSGESWDIKDLYIADASVFPSALGVNPQVTVMATAIVIARAAAG
ncbi:MAG: GMC family oxidoreductase [Myxococcales bacterium]|nr:GMC family oxidoreductase [Myxococcales bacterium]